MIFWITFFIIILIIYHLAELFLIVENCHIKRYIIKIVRYLMPYKINFNEKFFEVIVSGKITLDDYRSFFKDLTIHENWKENLKVLFDFR